MIESVVLPESERNRLLRRVDWRFLLPRPRPNRTACLASGELQRAVSLISDEVASKDRLGRGDCDLAVAVDPQRWTIDRLWRSLRPGGSCYLELSALSYPGLNRIRARLSNTGFEDVRVYFAWPLPSRAPAQFWLPLDSPQALDYFLSNRSREQPLTRRLGLTGRGVALRSAVRMALPIPVSVTASKPACHDGAGNRSPSLEDIVRGIQVDEDHPSEPRPMHWLLLTGGVRSTGKAVRLAFIDDRPEPVLAVKMARVPEAGPGLKREACVLRAIHAARPNRLSGVPEVRFCSDEFGVTAVGETVLSGQPLFAHLTLDRYRELALKATDWLVDLAGAPELCPRAEHWDRLVEPALTEFAQNFGAVVAHEQVKRTRTLLESLPDLPVVCEQRDFSPWNVLVDARGDLVVLDWESAELRGAPLTDLIYFLSYLAFFRSGAMETGRYVETYRDLLDPATYIGRVTDECVRSYCARVGLDQSVVKSLRILTWILHSRSDVQHLTADVGGTPAREALERSLFLRLWKEEMRLDAVTRMSGAGSRRCEVISSMTFDSLPNTSLIICSRNRPVMLRETVESVLAGGKVPEEIVIVDQSDEINSALASLSTDRSCRIRYLWTDTVGLGRARNEGIAAASHDLMAIIDDDMFVDPDWLTSLIGALVESGDRSVVTGQVLATDPENSGSFAPSTILDDRPAVYTGRHSDGVLYTGNMAIHRAIVEDVGLFDDRLGAGTAFPSSEDNDYCYRLLTAGYQIVYAPDVIVYHRAWRSQRDFRRLRWSYGVGRGGYYTKHVLLRDRYMLRRMFDSVRGHVLSIPGNIRRDRERAWGDLALTLGILFGALRWLTTTRKKR